MFPNIGVNLAVGANEVTGLTFRLLETFNMETKLTAEGATSDEDKGIIFSVTVFIL